MQMIQIQWLWYFHILGYILIIIIKTKNKWQKQKHIEKKNQQMVFNPISLQRGF